MGRQAENSGIARADVLNTDAHICGSHGAVSGFGDDRSEVGDMHICAGC